VAGNSDVSEQPPDLEARLQAVRDAFPDPGFDPSWRNECTCGECQDIEAYVHARPHWREWNAKNCHDMNATPLMRESFEYFLPAFICATYVDPDEADVAVESAVSQFIKYRWPWAFLRSIMSEKPNKELFSRYDRAQQDVILDWLTFYAETWSIDDEQKEGYMRQIEELAASGS
jgi:hypothetical protein